MFLQLLAFDLVTLPVELRALRRAVVHALTPGTFGELDAVILLRFFAPPAKVGGRRA